MPATKFITLHTTILAQPEGLQRASEYCSRAYPVALEVPPRRSLGFVAQLAGNLASSMPLSLSRYCSAAMREQIAKVLSTAHFDSVVCDFLAPAPNFADMSSVVLFQHNVETMIWRRHVEQAPDPLRKAYFKMQADRMFDWERRMCRAAARVIAVSPQDAAVMRDLFGIEAVSVATGVDLDYFRRPPDAPHKADLVFVGSMDWLPNSDGVNYFVQRDFAADLAAETGLHSGGRRAETRRLPSWPWRSRIPESRSQARCPMCDLGCGEPTHRLSRCVSAEVRA